MTVPFRTLPLRILTILITVAALLTVSVWAAGRAVEVEFNDIERQTRQFMEYNRNIELTPAQEKVRKAALLPLAAPCCSDRSAYTCCCECNLSRATWGLSKYLVADLGYDADQVRDKVVEWYEAVNPAGFPGDSCYSGGCMKPFAAGGCGGMNEQALIF